LAADAVAVGLAQRDAITQVRALEIAEIARVKSAGEKLAELAKSTQQPENVRRQAIQTLASLGDDQYEAIAVAVLRDGKESPTLREQMPGFLVNSKSVETMSALAITLETAPARVQLAVALAMANRPESGTRLLDLVAAGKASPRLLLDRNLRSRLGTANVPNATARTTKLTEGLPNPDQKIEELVRTRFAGFAKAKTDLAIGANVFKTQCANCHQLGGQGAKVGPQLDGIGSRGVARLLEDLLDPSRNVDQALVASRLELANGRIVTGLVLREEGNVLILADDQGKDVRIPKGDILEQKKSQLSPMPGNFAETLKDHEFYSLLAYLLAQQGKEK
jgi:putative heme-binding domain-containing protein